MKKIFCILFGLLMLPISGCTSGALKPYQGHWVEIGGNTTLDFSGSRLTVETGWSKEKYRVKAEQSGTYVDISNADGSEGFGMMSSITDNGSGKLIAYEMILDGRSHTYEFVRQEQLEEELEIKDLSDKDAPKNIESEVITEFSFRFEGSYDLDDSWPDAVYSYEIYRQEDGTYIADYSEMFDSSVGRRYNDSVSEEFVLGLDKILRENGAMENNGYHLKNNNRNKSDYSLYVTYDSGETLSVAAEGDAADSCVFKLTPIMEQLYNEVLKEEFPDWQ